MSLGGRVVLINVVLNVILIYTLSFYKAPKKVLKEIIKIQNNFLWSSTEQRKSIHWVNWTKVCTSKDKGCIGIKNIKVLNISLLLKWKWRIIHDKEAVWYGLLKHYYRHAGLELMNGGGRIGCRKDSIWWRNLLSLCRMCESDEDPFIANIVCVIGNDSNASF